MGHRPPPVWQQLPGEGKKTRLKRWLKILGVVTGLAAAAFFVVYAYRTLHGQDLRALLRPQVALALCLMTLLYTALIPVDRKSTRLNSSTSCASRMHSSS